MELYYFWHSMVTYAMTMYEIGWGEGIGAVENTSVTQPLGIV